MKLHKLILTLTMLIFVFTPPLRANESSYTPQDDLHFRLYDDKKYDKALIPMRHAANNGDAEAQYRMGKMYSKGLGTEKNLDKTLHYYLLAANQNHKYALNNLAGMYLDGVGVDVDYKQAQQLYSRAVKFGNAVAARNLGMIYEHGYGVTKDFTQAKYYYHKAVKMGRIESHADIADLYRYGKGVNENKSVAIFHYRKAAEAGDSAAANAIKELHEMGAREIVHSRLPTDGISFPVFRWSTPSEQSNESNTNRQNNSASKKLFSLSKAQELSHFELIKNANKVDLVDNGSYTTVSHQPTSAYSKWVLPNFFLPTRKNNSNFIPMWYVIDLHFVMTQGQSFKDYGVPVQFRTFLSPNNLVEVSLFKTGHISVVTSKDEKRIQQFYSKKTIDEKGSIQMKLWFTLDGRWNVEVNKEVIGAGRLEPDLIVNGSSNHFFIESNFNLKHLTIEEVIFPKAKSEQFLYGLNSQLLQTFNEVIAKNFEQEYLYNVINSKPIDFENWLYLSHEHLYTRRTDLQTVVGSDIDGKKIIVYSVGLNVIGQNRLGQKITVPLIYTLAIDDATKKADSVLMVQFDDAQESSYLNTPKINELVSALNKE